MYRTAPTLLAAVLRAAALAALLGAPAAARAEAVLIRGGTLLTASRGTLEGDLLVIDGRIAEVGGTIPPPAGARVIEARGRFVMPGIIDTHSHMGVYPWTVASTGNGDGNEMTAPITPQVRAEDSIHLEDPAFERARAGGVTSALILPGSANLIGGEGVVVKLRPGASLEQLRFAGAPRQFKMAMGENPKRVYGGKGQLPSTRMGNLAFLREAFRLADARADAAEAAAFFETPPFRPSHRDALRAILSSRGPEGKRAVRLQVHCYTRADIEGLLRLADEFGFEVSALHHALEAYKVRDELARRGIGVATFADWWGFKQEAWDAIPENAGLCAKAGVKVAIHSDSADHVQRLWHEAAKCVAHGMDPDDAIRAITLWPASILGISERTGSLDAGKDADIAIFSRHPFDVTTRVETTLIDGRIVHERRDFTPPAPEAAPEAIALAGGRIVPVSGPPIEAGVLVMRAGRIAAVGGPDTPVPEGALRVDVSGRTLIPGMVDADTSVGMVEVGSDPATQDDDESSGYATPHVRALDGFNPDSETVHETRLGGVTTVVLSPDGSNLLGGLAAAVDLEGSAAREMVVKDPVGLWANLSDAAVARGRGKGAYTSRMGMVAALRELLLEAQEHARKLERHKLELERWRRGQERRARKAAERAAAPAGATLPAAGKDDDEEPPLAPEPPGRKLRIEALLPVLEGKLPLVVTAHREADIRTALALAEEFGLKLVLNRGTEAYRVAPLLAARKVPVLVGPVTTQPSHHETWNAVYENAAILHAAGVKIAIRHGGAHSVRLLPFQAGIAVAYGLPAEAALRAVTLAPAEILGIAEDHGSLDPGKLANVVVLSGEPLQSLSRVEKVYIRGREVSRTSHQRRLFDKWKEAPMGGK
jgi:imidazolonepropionase-like amidohydrolase